MIRLHMNGDARHLLKPQTVMPTQRAMRREKHIEFKDLLLWQVTGEQAQLPGIIKNTGSLQHVDTQGGFLLISSVI